MGAACGVSGTGEVLGEGGGHDGDRTALGEPGLGGADDRERGGSNKEKKWIKTGK